MRENTIWCLSRYAAEIPMRTPTAEIADLEREVRELEHKLRIKELKARKAELERMLGCD